MVEELDVGGGVGGGAAMGAGEEVAGEELQIRRRRQS